MHADVTPKTALLLGAATCALAFTPHSAAAYATGSSATKDCHERMTIAALDAAGYPGGATPPRTDDGRALARQLAVRIPERHHDLWAASLVIGTRWPDFEGAEPSDFVALNGVHVDPDDQREHCLRTAEQDDSPGDPAGSRAAVASCRQFILESVGRAVGPGDTLDLSATEEVDMWLAFVGEDRVAVQTYGFYLGQALHAIQDSFSHTVRTEDGRQIRHVLNYIEVPKGTHDPTVDGHEHLSELDDCELGTQLLDTRVSQATTASTELLMAVGAASTRAGRIAAAEAVLDRWLSFAEDGRCVDDISACDPPELNQPVPGCAAGGMPRGIPLLALAGLLLLMARRSGRAGTLAALLVVGAAAQSHAQDVEAELPATSEADDIDEDTDEDVDEDIDETPTEAEAEAEIEEETNVEADVVARGEEPDEVTVVQRREVEADDGGFAVNDGVGFQVSLFGSLDEGGVGGLVGVRFPLAEHFILGVDAEYDAWVSAEAGRLERGALNAYLTGIIVWKTLGRVEIRSNLHAGITVQLSELYNSSRYSVGPMFGVTPVAFAVRLTRAVRLTVEPGGIFVEIPRVSPGPPLLRRAHRLMIGLQITP